MGLRSTLVKFSIPLLSILFTACSSSSITSNIPTTPPPEIKIERKMPYFPDNGYKQIDENTWFANNTGLPYMLELEGKRLVWQDAIAYNNGEFVAINEIDGNLQTPKVIHIDQYGKPRILFGEKFSQKFNEISLDANDYGVDGPEEELALIMQYDNKESVVIIDTNKMLPEFWYEADDISLIDQDGSKTLIGTLYEDTEILTETYKWDGVKYERIEVPKEIRLTDEMIGKLEQNKSDLLATFLYDPQQAIEKAQGILGTDNPIAVSTALQFATRDAYAVDEDGVKPLWKYLVEYDIQDNEARGRVAVDPLVVYLLLKNTGIGQTSLPWADNEPLAIVVAKELSKDSDNTYINLRLVRDEEGKYKLKGEIEPGKRMVKIIDTAHVYLPVVAEEAKKIQDDISKKTRQNIEIVKDALKKSEEISRQTQQQTQQQIEELKRKVNEEFQRRNEELKQKIDEQKRQLEQEIDEAKGKLKDIFKKK